MSSNVYRREDCRFCRSRELELVLQLAPTPLGSDYLPADRLAERQECYPIDLFLCNECGYVGLRDVVDPSVIWDDSTQATSMSGGLVDHFRDYSDDPIHALDAPEGSLIVDIGSNDGTFLKFFQNKGMRVLGIDPSRYISEKANESGVPTLCDYFTTDLARTIRAEHGAADVITANRVIANVDNLAEMMGAVKELMARDGTFVFETGYLVDIIQDLLFDTIYHEHLGYDSVRALETLFPRFDMELIDIHRVPIKGGSLRGQVQHRGGPRTASSSIANFVATEEAQGFTTAEPFRSLASKLEVAKTKLHDLLNGLKANGHTIAGYGAYVGSTTQIYHLDLGNLLSFLADDDPRNQSLFSPGYHIPVMPSQAIYDEKADYVVILAWRYSESIIKKHHAFLEQGGHFIIPLPEIQIVSQAA